jgi:hypothetical protein
MPPSCSSTLALAPSSNVAATPRVPCTESSPTSPVPPPAFPSALSIVHSRESRWAARAAENYARVETIRATRHIKPMW